MFEKLSNYHKYEEHESDNFLIGSREQIEAPASEWKVPRLAKIH